MYVKSTVELVDFMGDDKRACDAARVSLLNDEMESPLFGDEPLGERDRRLIKFLLRERHTSPFEHSFITFRVYAPLPIVAQIMRHRTFSYNQASRRYTSEELEFFDMTGFRKQAEKNLQASTGELIDAVKGEHLSQEVRQHTRKALELYNKMLEEGVCREQARFVLPQSLMARFYMSGNLHNFLKFLFLRDSEHAQKECRDVAKLIRWYLEDIFPETMGLVKELQEQGGN